MKVFIATYLTKSLIKQQVSDEKLLKACEELRHGLSDGDLGANVYKKRIALKGKGKRGGGRLIIAYRYKARTLIMDFYAKSNQENLTDHDVDALQEYGRVFFKMSDVELEAAIRAKQFREIEEKGSEQN